MYLAVLGLHCCTGFSLVVMHRLLLVLTPLVVEHGLEGMKASVVAGHGLTHPYSGSAAAPNT